MLAGLNGHGKTTTAGKLALFVRKNLGKNPYLVACDTYRPAAIDQLQQIGKELGVPVYTEGTEPPPEEIAERGIKAARGEAALSVVSVTGRPIKFASEGEKMGEFDYFYPDRMAGRILGMGDVLT